MFSINSSKLVPFSGASLRTRASASSRPSRSACGASGSDEMNSQLAEFDARELTQIERALTRLKQGTYGVCEGCQIKIPVARLNALPYSTACIKCQREMEVFGNWDDRRRGDNWEKVSDSESALGAEPEINLSDLEMDLTK